MLDYTPASHEHAPPYIGHNANVDIPFFSYNNVTNRTVPYSNVAPFYDFPLQYMPVGVFRRKRRTVYRRSALHQLNMVGEYAQALGRHAKGAVEFAR